MKTDYGLPDPTDLLPNRPIGIRRPGFADRFRMLFLGGILGLVSIGTMIIVWPSLYADYRIKSDPVAVPEASLVSSECKTKKMSVNCKADIAYPRDGQTQIRSVEFSFFSLTSGDYETTIVAEKGNSDNITLSLAIDEFWSRFIGSALIVFGLGAVAVLMVRRFIHLSTTLKALKETAPLTCVWARITLESKKWGRTRITYYPITGLRKGMGIVSLFAKNETPWMHFVPSENETFVLAVQHPGAILPVMLDEDFDRLDLTPQEVADARTARDRLVQRIISQH